MSIIVRETHQKGRGQERADKVHRGSVGGVGMLGLFAHVFQA